MSNQRRHRRTLQRRTLEAVALASAATSVARKVHKHDGATRRDLARAIAGKHRQLGVTVDDAIARAVADGYIADDGAGWRPSRRTP